MAADINTLGSRYDKEIMDSYENKRPETQKEIAKRLNEEHGTRFKAKDVGEITKAHGYQHGIKRDKGKAVVVQVSKSFRKHAQPGKEE